MEKRVIEETARRYGRSVVSFALIILATSFFGLFEPFTARPVSAAIPTTIGYQGRLKDTAGTPQTGTFTFVFRLYASTTGGVALYSETQTISVDTGFFAAQIGSVTAFPVSIDFNDPMFLTTEVNGDGEMSPRITINAVPYAYTAGGVSSFSSAPVSATGGRMYYDMSNGSLNYYDAVAGTWRNAAASSANQTFTNVTSTNVTTTNFFATNEMVTNSTITNLTVTNPLTVGGLNWTSATGTNTTSTNLFATNGTILNLSFTSGTSTSWFGFVTASGTTVNASAATINSLIANAFTSPSVTVSGGTINGTAIGNTSASTGVFTSVTSTSATSTNIFATNAQFTNLSFTNPLTVAGLNWTSATGTNTTSTNLFATNGTITNLSFANGTSTGWFGFTTASGTTVNASAATINSLIANAFTSPSVTVSGGTINGTVIGNTSASTGVFTSVTSTSASSTNFFATNGTIANLSITNPLTVGGLIWTNATGTNTTTTNLAVTGAATSTFGGPVSTTQLKVDGSILSTRFLSNVAGTGVSPSFSFIGDTDTGLYENTLGSTFDFALNGARIGFFSIGGFNVAGAIAPTTNNTRDLGLSTLSFRDLYASGTQNTLAGLNWTNATGTNVTTTKLFATNLAFTNATGTNATTTNLSIDGTISGAGLTADCSAADSKLVWSATTRRFSCATDLGGNLRNASSTASVDLTPANTKIALLTVTTTPSNANSEIWIVANLQVNHTVATLRGISVEVWRGTASLCTTPSVEVGNPISATTSPIGDSKEITISVVDAPGTTSATGYTLCAAADDTAGGVDTVTNRTITTQEVNVGADLAEVYYSQDKTLKPGDVVRLDPQAAGQVLRSETAYDDNTLGVISTRPGLVISASRGVGMPVMVALSGRIPVAVTAENGAIAAGDYLTASNVPGVAMKATKAGTAIGQALGSFNGPGVGKVMTFVKNTYYQGKPAVVVGSESASASAPTGSDFDILNIFRNFGATFGGMLNASSITAGAINSPELTALAAQNNQVSSTLQTLLAASQTSTSGLMEQRTRLTDIETALHDLQATIATSTSGPSSLRLADLRFDGGLEVYGEALFHSGLRVDRVSAIGDLLTFAGDAFFFGRPYVNADTAGFAIIRKGDQTVTVTFDQEYLTQPVVNAAVSFERLADEATTTYKARMAQYFTDDLRSAVTQKNTHGFTIFLNKPATQDIPFSWLALAVKDARIILSSPEEASETSVPAATAEPVPPAPVEEPVPTPDTAPTPEPILEEPAPTPDVASAPAPEPEPEPVPEPIPIPSETP